MRPGDIPVVMKTIACIPLLFAAIAWADETSDRAAIGRVIAALNDSQTNAADKRSRLFTADADNELDGHPMQPSGTPWSEVTAPRIVVHAVRFVTPEVALVDAANTQYGSVIVVRRVPVLLVMRKEGTEWRIASVRVLMHFAGLP